MHKLRRKEVSLKKWNVILLLLAGMFLLSACSVRSDAAQLYKQEIPIEVEINLPESISNGDEITVQAVLTQEGKKLEKANFVHFEIWKQDGSIRYPMKEAKAVGNGIYQMSVGFKSDGLYTIEVHAGNNGSLVSPQKQFMVGKLSANELNALKQGPKKEEGTQSHHH
jgi:hypothetical protein